MRKVLLLLILFLFLTLQSMNMQWYAGRENASPETGDPADSMTERKISYNNNGEIYRDGIVDNLDNFRNQGYPAEHGEACFRPVPC